MSKFRYSQGWLGQWVSSKRHSYKIGTMLKFPYRVEYLKSAGFVWELKRDGKWLLDRPEPNLKAVELVIKKERGTPVARALQTYLDNLPAR